MDFGVELSRFGFIVALFGQDLVLPLTNILSVHFFLLVSFAMCGLLMVFFSSGSQCWYFSHKPSSLFHHSVLVDLNVSMMMH